MTKMSKDSYDSLKKFLLFYQKNLSGSCDLGDEYVRIVQESINKAESISMAVARVGLKQALNDIIQRHSGDKPEAIALMDGKLKAEGLISFSELRRQFSSTYGGIVKRGVIRNEAEYYLVRGVLDDGSPPEEERSMLGQLLNEFEAVSVVNAVNKRKRPVR